MPTLQSENRVRIGTLFGNLTAQSDDARSDGAAQVLYTLLTHPRLARSEISRMTRLAPSTVSKIANDLMEEGVIRRAGSLGGPGAGRPSDLLSRNPSAGRVASVHVTPERCRIGIVDLGYAVLDTQDIVFDEGFTETQSDAVAQALAALASRTEGGSHLTAVALALPNYPYSVPAIRASFERAFPGTPVHRINNSEAMAVQEYYSRLVNELHTVAYVYVGTGIGSGLIIGGNLYRGVNGNACDVGHMYITEKPLACRCGREGCLETVASERALATALTEHYGLARPPAREEIVSFISARLAENDRFCGNLVRQAAEYLAKGICNLVSITDPQRVIVCGRLNALNPLYSSLVEEAYMRRTRLITPVIVPLEFVPLRDDGALVGAAMFSFISLYCGSAQGTAVAV